MSPNQETPIEGGSCLGIKILHESFGLKISFLNAHRVDVATVTLLTVQQLVLFLFDSSPAYHTLQSRFCLYQSSRVVSLLEQWPKTKTWRHRNSPICL